MQQRSSPISLSLPARTMTKAHKLIVCYVCLQRVFRLPLFLFSTSSYATPTRINPSGSGTIVEPARDREATTFSTSGIRIWLDDDTNPSPDAAEQLRLRRASTPGIDVFVCTPSVTPVTVRTVSPKLSNMTFEDSRPDSNQSVRISRVHLTWYQGAPSQKRVFQGLCKHSTFLFVLDSCRISPDFSSRGSNWRPQRPEYIGSYLGKCYNKFSGGALHKSRHRNDDWGSLSR